MPKTGCPARITFFITFDTNHPEAQLADWLRDRYPDEMTVVMQHWFDALEVGDEGFSVTLNFGESPEPLHIPYDAIQTFVDPSVEFGLRFESHEEGDDDDDIDMDEDDLAPITNVDDGDVAKQDAEVVSLDSFRK